MSVKVRTLSNLEQLQRDDVDLGEQIFKCYCSITSFISLILKWNCRLCNHPIIDGECYSKCKNASRDFTASAFLEVTDNCATANVNIDGERLITKLLRLTSNQMNDLKQVAMNGEIKHTGWNSKYESPKKFIIAGMSFEDMINQSIGIHGIWLHGNLQKRSRKRRHDLEDNIAPLYDPIIKPITMSDSVGVLHSYQYIKIKINIVEYQDVDPVQQAYDLLENIKNRK
jgi:hypothetical protein